MQLRYFVPGPMSKGPLGPGELARREKLLTSWLTAGSAANVRDAPDGPHSIETEAESQRAEAIAVDGALAAEREGEAAVIIGCFGDPGVEAARQHAGIPVVGPGEASLRRAVDIGERFSIITILDSVVPLHQAQVDALGLGGSLASVRPIGIPVLDLPKDPERTVQRIVETGRSAVADDGADVLVMGCMSMSFMDIASRVASELGVPVVNAAQAALTQLGVLAAEFEITRPSATSAPPRAAGAGQRMDAQGLSVAQ